MPHYSCLICPEFITNVIKKLQVRQKYITNIAKKFTVTDFALEVLICCKLIFYFIVLQ